MKPLSAVPALVAALLVSKVCVFSNASTNVRIVFPLRAKLMRVKRGISWMLEVAVDTSADSEARPAVATALLLSALFKLAWTSCTRLDREAACLTSVLSRAVTVVDVVAVTAEMALVKLVSATTRLETWVETWVDIARCCDSCVACWDESCI